MTAVKFGQSKAIKVTTDRKAGETLLKSFQATDATTVEIQGTEGIVTLNKKDGKWVIAERGNFPANNTYVNDFIRTLHDLKVTQAMEAGPSFAPRFGMDDSSSVATERGLTATIKNAEGKELAKVALGKTIDGASANSQLGMGSSSVGRYVRNYSDESGFYAVGELFPSVSADAKRWLSADFINPEKVQSVSVTEAGKPNIAWELTRESEEAEFKLVDAKTGEVLNTTVATPLKSIFSYARFEDVVSADKVASRAVEGQKSTAVIKTVEGFTYTVNLWPTHPPEPSPTPASPEEEPAAATDNYLLTVDVAADLPETRKKPEGESEEDAKKNDAAFTERHKSLSEKLAKEKTFSGITFEVTKALVDPLLKDRAALTAKVEVPEPAAATGNIQSFPGGMVATPPITATTPPISIPFEEEEEMDDEIMEDDEDEDVDLEDGE